MSKKINNLKKKRKAQTEEALLLSIIGNVTCYPHLPTINFAHFLELTTPTTRRVLQPKSKKSTFLKTSGNYCWTKTVQKTEKFLSMYGKWPSINTHS